LAFGFREYVMRGVGNVVTGVAWPSSARVVRCWVKSRNERNPYRMLYVSYETARANREEGEDDVRSAWPLRLGLHTSYNGQYNALPNREVELIAPKLVLVRIAGCNSPA
jgi:hypothetical protein